METTNTNVSTKRFTINTFKQEIKDLAKLQHDEKLFFKHPERYPNFIEEHKDALIAEHRKFRSTYPHSIPWRFESKASGSLSFQATESQIKCNERRMYLSILYKDYYALKHWKKLNLDDDLPMLEYFYKDDIDEYKSSDREDMILKMIEEKSKKTYIANSPELDSVREDLNKMYHDKKLTTSEYTKKIDEFPRISWFEYVRNYLLKYTDKEE